MRRTPLLFNASPGLFFERPLKSVRLPGARPGRVCRVCVRVAWSHGLPPCKTACDRGAHVRTLVQRRALPHCRAPQARPGTPVKAPKAPSHALIAFSNAHKNGAPVLPAPLLAALSALMPTRHEAR